MITVTYSPGDGMVLVSGARGLFVPVEPGTDQAGELARVFTGSLDELRDTTARLCPSATAWDLDESPELWHLADGGWTSSPIEADSETAVGEPDDRRYPIAEGTAPAAGVRLRPTDMEKVDRQPMPDANLVGRAVGRGEIQPERSDDDTFDLDSLLARRAAESMPPETEAARRHPRVTAIRCPCSAVNRPGERFCRRCGLDLVAARIPTVEVSWPVVATIRLDDGQSFELSRPLVVGRSPRRRPPGDPAMRLTVESPALTVSSSHIELRPDGWDVLVTDLGSANGAFVEGRGAEDRSKLPVNQPTRLEHGSVVWFGDRSLTVRLVHGS